MAADDEAAGEVLIGRLSASKAALGPLILGPLCLVLVAPMTTEAPDPRNIAITIGVLVGLLLSFWPLYKVVRARGRGLFIRDGRLYEAISGASAPLADIQFARREDLDGNLLRTQIALDIVSSRPGNPAFDANGPHRTIYVETKLYRTSSAEMLTRLEALGVKVRGSKTKLVGT